MRKILVIGASGQIGTDLVLTLRNKYGNDQVVASDLRRPRDADLQEGPFEELDALDADQLLKVVRQYNVGQVYLLAAILSAKAEDDPRRSWDLNMGCLFNVLDLAREKYINKVFWPSSIAVFGPTSPKYDTPQRTVMEPDTVYGVSKLAGERWCEYYHTHFDVDVRSIRYPGLISYRTEPGGGTTDYAVDIFRKAVEKEHYQCYLSEGTTLPMMYMPDAIEATIRLMETEPKNVKVRSSYNIAGISFAPREIAEAIQQHIPGFTISYQIDHRETLAKGWPASIDDKDAREDWGWKHQYELSDIVSDMLDHVRSPVERE